MSASSAAKNRYHDKPFVDVFAIASYTTISTVLSSCLLTTVLLPLWPSPRTMSNKASPEPFPKLPHHAYIQASWTLKWRNVAAMKI